MNTVSVELAVSRMSDVAKMDSVFIYRNFKDRPVKFPTIGAEIIDNLVFVNFYIGYLSGVISPDFAKDVWAKATQKNMEVGLIREYMNSNQKYWDSHYGKLEFWKNKELEEKNHENIQNVR